MAITTNSIYKVSYTIDGSTASSALIIASSYSDAETKFLSWVSSTSSFSGHMVVITGINSQPTMPVLS